MPSCIARSVAVFLSLCFLFVSSLPAQDLTFVKVPLSSDNSLRLIAGITQDKQGFLWLATHTGLHRYDGYQQTTYINNRLDLNSLADNRLECVIADRNGCIWIGVLYRVDPERYGIPHVETGSIVRSFYEDPSGYMLLGTSKGLIVRHTKSGKEVHYRHNPADENSIAADTVSAIYKDRQGNFWLGHASTNIDNSFLSRFNLETRTFTSYRHDRENESSLSGGLYMKFLKTAGIVYG